MADGGWQIAGEKRYREHRRLLSVTRDRLLATGRRLSAKRRRWLRGIPIQLLLWTTVPAMLILVILAVVGVVGHQRAMQELVQAHDTLLVRAIAGRLSDRLEVRTAQLEAFAAEVQPMLLQSNGSAMRDLHPRLTQSFDRGVILVSPQGDILVSFPQTAPIISAIPELLNPMRDAGRSIHLLDDPVTGAPLVLLTVPAGENWLVGGLSLRELGIDELLSALAAEVAACPEPVPGPDLQDCGEGRIYVVDVTGQVAAAFPAGSEPVAPRGQPGVEAALRGEAGAMIASVGETVMIVTYAPISSVGWAIVTQEPWDAVVGPMMRFSLVIPLILVGVAVAALITIIFGLRFIVRPLQQLDRQAARLAWGDFEAIQKPVGGTHEIEDLRHTLNDLAQQIRTYQQGMRDYIGAITRGQEEERKRLARELHDDTVQDLIALGQRVEMARRALERDPAAVATRLEELKDMINETLAEIRRFTHALRPIYLEDLGLLPALEMLVRDVESQTDTKADFHVAGATRRLPEDLELTIFRIAQESLSNVVQHARAEHVTVELRFMEHEVTLMVTDDGAGFSVPERPEELVSAGHFGLVGMHERAALVGGRLVLESEPHRGTCVTVHLPIPER